MVQMVKSMQEMSKTSFLLERLAKLLALFLKLYRLFSFSIFLPTDMKLITKSNRCVLLWQGVGGIVECAPGYLTAVYDIIRKAGGLCIADEVQAGFGRTGQFWGFENHGVVPDIVTMAKVRCPPFNALKMCSKLLISIERV